MVVLFGCGGEPVIRIPLGGQTMKRLGAFTTYNRTSDTNQFLSVCVVNGKVFAGSTQGLYTSHEEKLQPVTLKGVKDSSTLSVYRILFTQEDGKDLLYLATSQGIFRYYIQTKESQRLNVGDSSGKTIFLSVYKDELGHLYCGSDGEGLFYSIDKGATWSNYKGEDLKFYSGELDLTYEQFKEKEKANPLFVKENGIIKVEPFYQDEPLKNNTITDVVVHKEIIYVATYGGGVSYTPRPNDFSSWNPLWTTYLEPWYFFDTKSDPQAQSVVSQQREREKWATLPSRYVKKLLLEDFALFAATTTGLSVSHFPQENISTVPHLDDFGRKQYASQEDMKADHFLCWPQLRPWHLYLDKYLFYSPFGKLGDHILDGSRSALESEHFYDIHVGTLNEGATTLLYVGTECGLSIAELTRDENNQPTFEICTTWVTYHNYLSSSEETWVNDFFVEKDAQGNDSKVYIASNGQGLIVFQWEK